MVSSRTATLLGSNDDRHDSISTFIPHRTNNNNLQSPSRYSYASPHYFSSRLFSSSTATTTTTTTTITAQTQEEEEIELPTNDNDLNLLKIRHTAAHVMAMAVQRLYPEAQVTIGPWISNGFYYDFYFPETTNATTGEVIPSRKLNEEDLKQIKKAMDKIISELRILGCYPRGAAL